MRIDDVHVSESILPYLVDCRYEHNVHKASGDHTPTVTHFLFPDNNTDPDDSPRFSTLDS